MFSSLYSVLTLVFFLIITDANTIIFGVLFLLSSAKTIIFGTSLFGAYFISLGDFFDMIVTSLRMGPEDSTTYKDISTKYNGISTEYN